MHSSSSGPPARRDAAGGRGLEEEDREEEEVSAASPMLGEYAKSSSSPSHPSRSASTARPRTDPEMPQSTMHWAVPAIGTFMLLALIIWDMRKVQQLSIVIHDDHSDLWVDMNESLVSEVYTPLSLCVLKEAQDMGKKSISDIRSECALSNRREHFSFCAVGSSLGKECSGSLHSHNSFYFKTLADDSVAFASSSLHDTMYHLAAAGWALVFIGDKVSQQNLHALICAMDPRRHSNFDIHQEHTGNFTMRWRTPAQGSLTLEVSYVPLRGITPPAKVPGRPRSGPRHVVKGEDGSTRRSGPGKRGAGAKAGRIEDHDAAGIINGSIPAPPSYFALPAVQARVKKIMDRHRGVAVISNVGSYYNARIPFRKDIATLLNWLNELGENNIVFFRESAAQHWNVTRNGYHINSYTLGLLDGGRKNSHFSCQPNEDSSPDLDWRNSDALAYITTNDLSNIEWIPFHDVTAPLYNMHPYGPNASDTDCTQYCYFPEMWQPVWGSFNKVIPTHERLRPPQGESTSSSASHGGSNSLESHN